MNRAQKKAELKRLAWDGLPGFIILLGIFGFAIWFIWTLASGILGITLGQMLFGAVLVYIGYLIGRG
jgi:hypothetical protein